MLPVHWVLEATGPAGRVILKIFFGACNIYSVVICRNVDGSTPVPACARNDTSRGT
jgi:hypothetical protein